MEEDRAATNLGPDIEYEEPQEIKPESKQPRKRFIGRRAAEERAAAKELEHDGQVDTLGVATGTGAITGTPLMLLGVLMVPLD